LEINTKVNMKKIIKRWLGITDIERQISEIHRIVVDSRQSNLEHTADLARLIIDTKMDSISMGSMSFICRMNLNIKKIKDRIPMDYGN